MGRCSLTTYTFASEVICHLTCTPDAAWCNLKFNKIDVINVMVGGYKDKDKFYVHIIFHFFSHIWLAQFEPNLILVP